jgi:hypothetical protein
VEIKAVVKAVIKVKGKEGKAEIKVKHKGKAGKVAKAETYGLRAEVRG